MNERLLREWIKGVLSEATILITYDDGSDTEISVSDRYARGTTKYLKQQRDVSGLADSGMDPEFLSQMGEAPPGIEPGEEVKLTLEHPDTELQEKIETALGGRQIIDILGGPNNVKPDTARRIRRIIAQFEDEEIDQIQKANPVVSTTDSPVIEKLTGHWAELINVGQGEPKVGKGEFAASLWYANAFVQPGEGEDLVIGGESYHAKFHAAPSTASGVQRNKSGWNTAVPQEVAYALRGFNPPANSLAAQYTNPEQPGTVVPLTGDVLQNMLIKVLLATEYAGP